MTPDEVERADELRRRFEAGDKLTRGETAWALRRLSALARAAAAWRQIMANPGLPPENKLVVYATAEEFFAPGRDPEEWVDADELIAAIARRTALPEGEIAQILLDHEDRKLLRAHRGQPPPLN